MGSNMIELIRFFFQEVQGVDVNALIKEVEENKVEVGPSKDIQVGCSRPWVAI